MSQESPPLLRFARQWTQPSRDLSQRLSLSHVTYPAGSMASPSPSPPRSSRVPLFSSPQTPNHGDTNSSNGLSAARPHRQPLVAAASPSPRPTRPSSTLLPLSHDGTPRRVDDARRAVSHSSGQPVAFPEAVSTAPPADDAGRLFWQQQAQRFEAANAALRAELQAVYRTVNGASNNSSRGSEMHTQAMSRKTEERSSVLSPVPKTTTGDMPLYSLPGSHEAEESRFATVVHERNMARIELAQEREKSFLLRHRLREAEMEIDRLEQRLREHSRHRPAREEPVRRSAPARRPAVQPSKERNERSGEGRASSRLPSRSRSASHTSLSSLSSTVSSPNFLPAAAVASHARRRGSSSPPPRSVTRHQPSRRSGSAEERPSTASSTVAASAPGETMDGSHVPRGYARLLLRRNSKAPPDAAQRPSRAASQGPQEQHQQQQQSHLLAGSALRLRRAPDPPSRPQPSATPAAPAEAAAAETRESDARALLSSLLAAHSSSSSSSSLSVSQSLLPEADGAAAFSSSWRSTDAPRHVFHSQLFRSGDSALVEASDLRALTIVRDRAERETQGDESRYDENAAVRHRRSSSSSDAGVHRRGRTSELPESYIARQLVSPTPPLRPRPSPPMMGGEDLTRLLSQRPSTSGAWMSVSVTTDDGSTSRSLSLGEDGTESAQRFATHNSYAL